MNPVDERQSISDSAAQTRANAIRTQLSLGTSFCDLAKTEIEFGRADQARRLIQKVVYIGDTAWRHIHETGHVPPDEVSSLTEQLMRLDARHIELEQQLAPPRPA